MRDLVARLLQPCQLNQSSVASTSLIRVYIGEPSSAGFRMPKFVREIQLVPHPALHSPNRLDISKSSRFQRIVVGTIYARHARTALPFRSAHSHLLRHVPACPGGAPRSPGPCLNRSPEQCVATGGKRYAVRRPKGLKHAVVFAPGETPLVEEFPPPAPCGGWASGSPPA